MTHDEAREYMLALRGVQNPCPRCGGIGKYTYPSTSGWRGGCAGMTPTTDVCDKCWGSGDATRPWADMRLVSATIENHADLFRIAQEAISREPRPSAASSRILDRALSVQKAWCRK